MVYRTPNDRLETHEDETVVVRDSGGNTGTVVLAGVLIVVAIVLVVWLMGGSGINPPGTTFTPVETTLPVGTGGANPTAPG